MEIWWAWHRSENFSWSRSCLIDTGVVIIAGLQSYWPRRPASPPPQLDAAAAAVTWRRRDDSRIQTLPHRFSFISWHKEMHLEKRNFEANNDIMAGIEEFILRFVLTLNIEFRHVIFRLWNTI